MKLKDLLTEAPVSDHAWKEVSEYLKKLDPHSAGLAVGGLLRGMYGEDEAKSNRFIKGVQSSLKTMKQPLPKGSFPSAEPDRE
ncbi:MAG: hypothetical protein Q8Q92_03395 [bacterium]|nr:hypothetical protein [bacterium]